MALRMASAASPRPRHWPFNLSMRVSNCLCVPETSAPVEATEHEAAPFATAASPPMESMSCFRIFAWAGFKPSSFRL